MGNDVRTQSVPENHRNTYWNRLNRCIHIIPSDRQEGRRSNMIGAEPMSLLIVPKDSLRAP